MFHFAEYNINLLGKSFWKSTKIIKIYLINKLIILPDSYKCRHPCLLAVKPTNDVAEQEAPPPLRPLPGPPDIPVCGHQP